MLLTSNCYFSSPGHVFGLHDVVSSGSSWHPCPVLDLVRPFVPEPHVLEHGPHGPQLLQVHGINSTESAENKHVLGCGTAKSFTQELEVEVMPKLDIFFVRNRLFDTFWPNISSKNTCSRLHSWNGKKSRVLF